MNITNTIFKKLKKKLKKKTLNVCFLKKLRERKIQHTMKTNFEKSMPTLLWNSHRCRRSIPHERSWKTKYSNGKIYKTIKHRSTFWSISKFRKLTWIILEIRKIKIEIIWTFHQTVREGNEEWLNFTISKLDNKSHISQAKLNRHLNIEYKKGISHQLISKNFIDKIILYECKQNDFEKETQDRHNYIWKYILEFGYEFFESQRIIIL